MTLAERAENRVAKKGYEVVSNPVDEATWEALEGDYIVARPGVETVFNPLEIPDLYLQFADTLPDTEGVLAFTRSFGPLVVNDLRVLDASDRLAHGESVARWKDWHRSFSFAFDAFEAIQFESLDYVSEMVSERDRVYVVRPRRGSGDVGGRTIAKDLPHFDCLASGASASEGRLLALKVYLQMTVNENLPGHVGPKLVGVPAGTYELALAPSSLLGSIWLQLAQEIERGKSLAKCEVCRRTVRPVRSTLKYCSDACKQRAYERRKSSRYS